jgi:uncharacterized protein
LLYKDYFRDNKKAFKFAQIGAENGNRDSLLLMGNYYYEGIGVTKDEEKAFQYFKEASKLNGQYQTDGLLQLYINK